jgi:hypothetical protein
MAVLVKILIVAAATRLGIAAYKVRQELDAVRRAHPGDGDEPCVQYLCGRISWRK